MGIENMKNNIDIVMMHSILGCQTEDIDSLKRKITERNTLLESLQKQLIEGNDFNPDLYKQYSFLKQELHQDTLRLKEKEAEAEQKRIEKELEEKRRIEEEKRRKEEEKRAAEEKHIQEVTSMDLPIDWVNAFDSEDLGSDEIAESIPDGFVRCLNRFGYVDIEYIAAICKADYKEVISALQGSIYQNPETWGECFFRGWETSEEYLSGNIRKKLKTAKENNKIYHGYFDKNVEALKKILPPELTYDEIYVTLGSPWIPVDVISEFVSHLMNKTWRTYRVKHDLETGSWEFDWDYHDRWDMDYHCREKYGTSRFNPMELLLRTLNMQSVTVYETRRSSTTKSGKVRVIDQKETVLAIEKQRLLIEEFDRWIDGDLELKDRLVKEYEERFGGIRSRHYDGSFLRFPNLNPGIKLYQYQKNAVARILFSPNTLLAHDVGAGKTYIMIAAGMELLRMGYSRCNMYVVPNNILGQWQSIFLTMYPDARLLTVEAKNLKKDIREITLNSIKEGEFDNILITYSSFTSIPISVSCQKDLLDLQIADVKKSLYESDYLERTKQLENCLDKLKEKKRTLACTAEIEEITFDQLGISRLFVDEAHNFKNVSINTKIENVMGINKNGSKKCEDMFNKVLIVQRDNHGSGVVFATGTPITNSVTDAYIMQRYLQGGMLKLMGIQNFDSWVGMFAERASDFEIDVDTSNYRLATRFSKFHNIPELTNMLATIADFHNIDSSEVLPEHDGYDDVMIRKTPAFTSYLQDISCRADEVRNGRVNRTEDNMLKITTDGRKAALDMRLVNQGVSFTTSCKAFACAERVAHIYRETAEKLSTQLIFCDISTPKDSFNVYDELRTLLVKMGVSNNDIAYVHDATTEAKRKKLFSEFCTGTVRVLIGSTFKLGIGVNVQDKLIALHHLDVPWRPADMAQREGRILRQGNENKRVHIYRYITEGSFDAYSWQLLETKQRFIVDLLSGNINNRSGSNVDETVLNYAEVKALAVGNPAIKERICVANELSRYLILQNRLAERRIEQEADLKKIPDTLKIINERLPLLQEDIGTYHDSVRDYDDEEIKTLMQTIRKNVYTESPVKKEVVFGVYQGFTLIAPQKTSLYYPAIIIKGAGSYTLSLPRSPHSIVEKIDKHLVGLPEEYKLLKQRKGELIEKSNAIKKELSNPENYMDRIEELKGRLEKLDQKLGVSK